jgi:hypothetical protein
MARGAVRVAATFQKGASVMIVTVDSATVTTEELAVVWWFPGRRQRLFPRPPYVPHAEMRRWVESEGDFFEDHADDPEDPLDLDEGVR